MLTDAPPRKANRTGFLESDRIRTLDLPQDEGLLKTTKSIESVMKAGTTVAVRRACAEFLDGASNFYKVPDCGIRVLAARPLRGLLTRTHADPSLDADGGTEGSHIVRYVPEHALPRVLPPS
jgi:hypothetical protein